VARGRGEQFERLLEQQRRDLLRNRERAIARVREEAERGELERATALANEAMSLLPRPDQRRELVDAIASACVHRLQEPKLSAALGEALKEVLSSQRRLPENPLEHPRILARLYAEPGVDPGKLEELAAALTRREQEDLVLSTRHLDAAESLRRRLAERLLGESAFWDEGLSELRDRDPRQQSPYLGADEDGRAHLLDEDGGAVCGARLTGQRPPAGALLAARPPCAACLAALTDEHPAWPSERARLAPALRTDLIEVAARGIAAGDGPLREDAQAAVRDEFRANS